MIRINVGLFCERRSGHWLGLFRAARGLITMIRLGYVDVMEFWALGPSNHFSLGTRVTALIIDVHM